MVWVDPWACFFGAMLVLTVPLPWLGAAVCAAAVHEGCHLGMLRLCGGKVLRMRIGIGGAEIETGVLEPGRELLCALAGPMGSLALLLLCRHAPRLAICGGIQGIFNLLPVWPLDGGRVLRCGLGLFWPHRAKKIGDRLEFVLLLGILLLIIWSAVRLALGTTPVLTAVLLILRAILRKKPCKQRQIRVQ